MQMPNVNLKNKNKRIRGNNCAECFGTKNIKTTGNDVYTNIHSWGGTIGRSCARGHKLNWQEVARNQGDHEVRLNHEGGKVSAVCTWLFLIPVVMICHLKSSDEEEAHRRMGRISKRIKTPTKIKKFQIISFILDSTISRKMNRFEISFAARWKFYRSRELTKPTLLDPSDQDIIHLTHG